MTRKDFELIAGALKSVRPVRQPTETEAEHAAATGAWQDTVTSVTNAVATTNQRFNQAKFLAACGWPVDEPVRSVVEL